MLYLLFYLNICAFLALVFLFRSYQNGNKHKRNVSFSSIRQHQENIKQIYKQISSLREELHSNNSMELLQACEEVKYQTEKIQALDIELQKIPAEVLEKHLPKIHIINLLPYKHDRSNVIEAELLQHGISAEIGYFYDVRSVVKLQFTDKEDYVGINEIVAVEKNEDGKTMLYFTLQTSEIDAIVIPQVAFVSCIDES